MHRHTTIKIISVQAYHQYTSLCAGCKLGKHSEKITTLEKAVTQFIVGKGLPEKMYSEHYWRRDANTTERN